MALTPAEALRRAGRYPHAVLAFTGPDGYPVNVAAPFRVDAGALAVEVGPLSPAVLPGDGAEVGVLFSHIRPQPGVGYDERRYVNAWGRAAVDSGAAGGATVRVAVERAAGWDEQEVPFFELVERSVPVAHDYAAEVGQRPHLSPFWTFFRATRLPFLTATVVPIALGGAVAARDGGFVWGWWLLALVAGICVHLGLNIANDLFDDASGADAANLTPTPFSGGSRVMQHGLVSRTAMVRACVAFYAVAALLGLVFAVTRGAGVLMIGAIGVFLSLAYTAPPLRLVHRGLGEPVTALGFGPCMVLGAQFVAAQRMTAEALYLSLPVGLLIALVLYVNEVPDRVGDAAAGKRTVPVRFGRERVVQGYRAGASLAFALIAAGPVAGITPWPTLVALTTMPLARRVARDLARHYDRPYSLMPAMQVNIGLHLFTGLLLLAGYLAAAAF